MRIFVGSTYLITGMSGFVGQHLANLLHKKYPRARIVGFDSARTRAKSTLHTHSLITSMSVDITDAAQVRDAIASITPDYVFHLAGQSSVKKSFDDPATTMRVNVEGTRNLIEALLANRLLCTTRVLIVSSADVYGPTTEKKILIPETHALHPVSPYGKSRVLQEEIVTHYIRDYGLQAVICRSFPHTGPGQPPITVCPSIARQIAEIEKGKQDLVLHVGNTTVVRDFSDVRDIISAYELLIHDPLLNGTFNVCSGKEYSIGTIIKTLVEYSSKKITITQDPALYRNDDIPRLVGNNTKLHKATGWKPRIAFEKTLKDLLEFYRRTG